MEIPKTDLDRYYDSLPQSQVRDVMENVRTFASILLNEFTTTQVVTILKGYMEADAFSYCDSKELGEDAGFLIRLHSTSFWSDEDVMNFQTRVMTNPAMTGVPEVFKEHRTYKQFCQEIDRPNVVVSAPIQMHSHPAFRLNNNNETQSSEFDDGPFDHFVRRPVIEYLDNDDAPQLETIDYVQVYDHLIVDCEEIEMIVIKPGSKGIEFVFEEQDPLDTLDIPQQFDLLLAFRVGVECKVDICAKVGSIRWFKQMDVKPGIWYNFAHEPLPHSSSHFYVSLEMTSVEEIVDLQVSGIHLAKSERRMLYNSVLNNMNPYDYGFQRWTKLKA